MSRRRPNARKREAQYLNDRTYICYYNQLMELALNIFDWKNLPPTCDARFLELELFSRGYCLYFNDPIIGDLTLSCTIGGALDVYRIPIERRAFATNGYNAMRTSADSVLIFNNRIHTPTVLAVEMYARRLYEVQRAQDINVRNQKFPLLIKSPEQRRLSMENLYADIDGNQPVIFTDDTIDLTAVEVLKTDAPFVADKLEILKHSIFNEALTYLGIENSNQDKRERLVSAEVTGNSGALEASRWSFLNSRRDAAEKINRMFGTEIEVGYNSFLNTLVNRATAMLHLAMDEPSIVESGSEGGAENG